MELRKKYGIDTGTSTVKIYSHSKDKIYVEKNMIAVREDDRKVVAVGDEAYEMFEKAPSNIHVDSPMAFGMIADIPRMEFVLYTLLNKIEKRYFFGNMIYFAIPMDLSLLEKRAYDTIVNSRRMNKNKIMIVEKPIADAIALGISPETTKGSMIVNIGAQSTEISILADSRVIISKIIPIGGKQMNLAICEEIRHVCQLQIGTRTARRLKVVMGNMSASTEEARKVYGIDSLSGLPREEVISSKIIYAALLKCMTQIGNEVKLFLERTPPQISYEILKEGIHLTGGSTRLPNIHVFLAEYTGYGVSLSELYEQSTVTGLKKIINDKQLQKWAVPMKQRKL
ncbi:MAG: rod shape-determining protein [Lachnospiraceae bacterium]|nr:rod shape-determining protein [Lachnospiraceae bacterium]